MAKFVKKSEDRKGAKHFTGSERRARQGRRLEDSAHQILFRDGIKAINDFTLDLFIQKKDVTEIMKFVKKVSEQKMPQDPEFYTRAIKFLLNEAEYVALVDIVESAAIAKALDRETAIMTVKTILNQVVIDEKGRKSIHYKQLNHVSSILGFISDHNRDKSNREDRIGYAAIFHAAIEGLAPLRVYQPIPGVEEVVPEDEGKSVHLREFCIQAIEAGLPSKTCVLMFKQAFENIRDGDDVPANKRAEYVFEMLATALRSHVHYDPVLCDAKAFVEKYSGDPKLVTQIEKLQCVHDKKQ